jgi:hypothetical protein
VEIAGIRAVKYQGKWYVVADVIYFVNGAPELGKYGKNKERAKLAAQNIRAALKMK